MYSKRELYRRYEHRKLRVTSSDRDPTPDETQLQAYDELLSGSLAHDFEFRDLIAIVMLTCERRTAICVHGITSYDVPD